MEASSGSVRERKEKVMARMGITLKETEEVEGNLKQGKEKVHGKGRLRKLRQLYAKELKMKTKEEKGIQETEFEENVKQGKEVKQAKEKEVDPKELEAKEEKGTEETEQAEEKLKPMEDERMQEEDWKVEKQDCIDRLKEKIALIRDDYKKVMKVWGEERAKAAYYDKMNYLAKTRLLSDLDKFSRRRNVELNLDSLYEESISWELGGDLTIREEEMEKETNVEEVGETLNSQVEEWKLNPEEEEELEKELNGRRNMINDGEPEKTFVSRNISGDFGLSFFLGGNFGPDNFKKARERTAEEVKEAEEREAKKQEQIRIFIEKNAKESKELMELAKYLGEERAGDVYKDVNTAKREKDIEAFLNMTEEQRAKDRKEQQDLKDKYTIQLRESQGFDIYDFPRTSICCNLPVSEYYDPADPDIEVACRKALALYNSLNGCNYQFVKVFKVNVRVCAGLVYFITFQARRTWDDSFVVFQTRVFSRAGTRKNRVDFCRLKNS